MKTTYWLVTAAAVAAAGVTIYARLTAGDPPLPKVPTVAEAPRDVPQIPLPPIVLPPDEPVGPPVPDTPPAPLPLPDVKPDTPSKPSVPVPTLSVVPSTHVETVSGFVPLVPPVPSAPATPPAALEVPAKPPVLPAKPEVPIPPSVPKPPPATSFVPPPPPTPVLPAPGPAPVLQPPVPAKPFPLPAPAPLRESGPREPLAVIGKFVVLKDDKLIEGAASVNNNTVIVRQGALDRPFPKSHVQYIAADKDEVYRFMLAKVPANDVAARLKVARWCMFSGLREQALTEAREVLKLQPNNTVAADMARSLELSLQQFPVENAAKMIPPQVPTFPAELGPATRPAPPIPPAAVADPEPDVTPEAALVFGARVQPFLANQCVECHAKPDFAGKFKLVRVKPQDAGPQATRANLRAVAGQLRKDDPAASPILLKSLSAHGGMKLPAVESRQAAAYLALEGWTALAVGTPIAAPPAAPAPAVPALVSPIPPVSPTADPVLPPTPPMSPLPPPLADPVLPLPAAPAPMPLLPPSPGPVGPSKLPVPPVADPLLPPPLPVVPAPAPVPRPVVPAIPQADPFVPNLPPAPSPKPVPVPVVPPIPHATAAPKPPSGVVPVSGTQFGAGIPPKPPVTGPSGDEFDPAGFNQQPRK